MISLDDILLRPLEPCDTDALLRYRNDPRIVGRLGGFSTGYSRKDIDDWMEFHRCKDNEVIWSIAESESNKCLGHVGLYNIDSRVGKAELAILIGERNRHRGGVGKRVCQAVINYSWTQLNLRRIELSLLSNNTAARGLYDSLGFEVEGVQKNAEYRDGDFQDVVWMALFRTH